MTSNSENYNKIQLLLREYPYLEYDLFEHLNYDIEKPAEAKKLYHI